VASVPALKPLAVEEDEHGSDEEPEEEEEEEELDQEEGEESENEASDQEMAIAAAGGASPAAPSQLPQKKVVSKMLRCRACMAEPNKESASQLASTLGV
jgi:hypothetical protein